MKHPTLASAALVAASLVASSSLQAQSGTWASAVAGNWSDTTKWTGGIVANGVDAIATFPHTPGYTVTQDLSGLTLGGFATSAGSNQVTIAAGSGGTITLATTTGVPTIASTTSLVINPSLTGTQGFLKNGGGRITIGADNSATLSGTIQVTSGALVPNNNGALGSGPLLLTGGNINAGTSGTRTLANNFTWGTGFNFTNDNGNGAGTAPAVLRMNGTGTLSGTGNIISSNGGLGTMQGYEFGGVLSGGTAGTTMVISAGNDSVNVYAAFLQANTFLQNIGTNTGGTTPSDGLGKRGSVGVIVGNDSALSSGTVQVASNTHRFFLASNNASARNLSNNVNWDVSVNFPGNAPAYLFHFGQYTSVTGTTKTVGGTGDIGVGAFNIQAGNQVVVPTYRRIAVDGSTTATINGVFSRSGSLSDSLLNIEKVGTGTLVLANASNTYSGGFSVSEGIFRVDGNLGGTGLSVASSGTLAGTGTISTAVTMNGTLAPGNSPGTLTVNNLLTLSSGSILDWDINVANTTVGGGINDLVTGITDLTLDGTINFTLSGGPQITVPGSWRLFNYSGTLTNNILTIGTLSLGSGLTASIDTSIANQVNLLVVPEPGTLAMLIGGASLLFLRHRRR